MDNNNTIPSQLGPMPTIPSALGPASGYSTRQPKHGGGSWGMVKMLLVAAAIALFMYLAS